MFTRAPLELVALYQHCTNNKMLRECELRVIRRYDLLIIKNGKEILRPGVHDAVIEHITLDDIDISHHSKELLV
jgi:hypothetical protein